MRNITVSSNTIVGGMKLAQNDDRLARILDEYLIAVERGSSITPEDVLARYPDEAEELRGYISGLKLFHAAIAPGVEKTGLTTISVHAGQTIGDYRLTREIARGGMGVVYEAWQVSLRRRVALKVLPFNSAQDAKRIGRFKNEAQAAAQVQHPNIVPVYAVGEEGGTHFYTMQIVDGRSLLDVLNVLQGHSGCPQSTARPTNTRNQDNQESNSALIPMAPEFGASPFSFGALETTDHVRAIARLGIQAAQALNAAHEFGVVHRDIKPSNLLIDDQDKLWITDFGLARCCEDGGLTQTGDVLGTMRYMSPEQARGDTTSIDHRTDVYSLGVTLYEMATLRHPAGGICDVRLYFERDHRPARPLRHWNRHIPIDYQTIVLKAMAESPQERYATAQELADDLQRYLDGRPILATPPTVWLRANKWVKRHGRAVAAATVLLIVTSMALSLILVRQKALAERSLAQLVQSWRQTHVALDRLSLLGDQLAAIPGADGVRHQLLEDLLGLYRQFEEQAVHDESVTTDLALAYSKSGGLWEKLGDNERALDAHQKAMTIWQKYVARDPSDAGNARNLALCQNNLGNLLAELGHPSRAIELLSSALTAQVELLAAEPDNAQLATDIATTHSNLGLVYSQIGQKQNAIEQYIAAIGLQDPLAQASNASETAARILAASLNNLASLYGADQPDAAAKSYERALEIQVRLVKAHPINRLYQGDLARTYNNIGFLAAGGKDWKKAELCYADAIRLQENLVKTSPLAATYRRDLAISYSNLGMVQYRHGRLQQAEASFREAMRSNEMLLKAQPADVQALSNQGSVFNNLGMLLDGQRSYLEAEKAYRHAVYFQGKALSLSRGRDGLRELQSKHYQNLARNLTTQGKHAEAIQVAAECRRLCENQPDELNAVAQPLGETYSQLKNDSHEVVQ
jgi:serine/threonine protein kinase/Tfp pilus assembly protein PilF